jgi:hypothetical protein
MNRLNLFFLCVFFIISVSTFSQDKKNEELQQTLIKLKKISDLKKYPKLYSTSLKSLEKYGKNATVNYFALESFFYLKNSKKFKKKYTKDEAYWNQLFKYLKKSKSHSPAQEFSADLQDTLFEYAQSVIMKEDWSKSFELLSIWFTHFDNSTENHLNTKSKEIQDFLFQIAKENYFANKLKVSNSIFDWMHSTFYKTNFTAHYIGNLAIEDSTYKFDTYANPKYCLANTADTCDYLHQKEKTMIYMHNIARMDPVLFEKVFLAKYITVKKYSLDNSYIASLIPYLKELKKMGILYPEINLMKAAAFHAEDMGNTGLTSHNSSDGTSFSDRLGRFNIYGGGGENCTYGRADAIDGFFSLLIDEGVPSLGHRYNIMYETFKYIGVSFQPHKTYGSNYVLDYGF